jgi:hypothetical protein
LAWIVTSVDPRMRNCIQGGIMPYVSTIPMYHNPRKWFNHDLS